MKLLEAIDDEELRERCENLLDPGCD